MIAGMGRGMPKQTIALFLIGVFLLVSAVYAGIRVEHFVGSAERADGVVTKLDGGGNHPEIEFQLPSGTKITYPQGGLIFGYDVGDHVTVLYDPGSPSKTARLSSIGALWPLPIILSFIALLFMSLGVLGLTNRYH
jgi:hypothetical protein